MAVCYNSAPIGACSPLNNLLFRSFHKFQMMERHSVPNISHGFSREIPQGGQVSSTVLHSDVGDMLKLPLMCCQKEIDTGH
jgi:hypothetical protein